VSTFVPVLDAAQVETVLRAMFPVVEVPYKVTDVGAGSLTVTMACGERDARPGGVVSGPTLMALADAAMVMCVVAHIGPEAMAVTTSLKMDFLTMCPLGDIVGRVELLKLSRRTAVGTVTIRGVDQLVPAAFATVTYAIPSTPSGVLNLPSA
jgi:uncharacterized protein (TIGR00369 family)